MLLDSRGLSAAPARTPGCPVSLSPGGPAWRHSWGPLSAPRRCAGLALQLCGHRVVGAGEQGQRWGGGTGTGLVRRHSTDREGTSGTLTGESEGREEMNVRAAQSAGEECFPAHCLLTQAPAPTCGAGGLLCRGRRGSLGCSRLAQGHGDTQWQMEAR